MSAYSSDLYDYIVHSGQSYRQEDCIELCVQQIIIKQCQCYASFSANLSALVGPCLSSQNLNCLLDQFNNFDLASCQALSCPLECDTIKYDLAVSSHLYPSKRYYENELNKNELVLNYSLEYLNKSLTYDMMREYSYSFSVYYPHMEYTLLTETPKTSIADFFAQIGGTLGLFVSYSIFTLFELIECFLLVLHGLLIVKKNTIVEHKN